MTDDKMDKIIYKPHCGKCGCIIDTSEYNISYQNIYEKPTKKIPVPIRVGTIINPDRCVHCGALFEAIEISMPKQLQDTFTKL